MRIQIRVQPGSKKEGIELLQDGTFKMKISSRPIEGQANERVVEIFSKALRIPKSEVLILKGEKSKEKLIGIPLELDQKQLVQILEEYFN